MNIIEFHAILTKIMKIVAFHARSKKANERKTTAPKTTDKGEAQGKQQIHKTKQSATQKEGSQEGLRKGGFTKSA